MRTTSKPWSMKALPSPRPGTRQEEQIDIAVADRRQKVINAFDGGRIRLYRLHLHAVGPQSLGRAAYRGLVGDDDKVIAVLGAKPRKFLADAAGGAGYHGEFCVLHLLSISGMLGPRPTATAN
jgi:hypothetical protein